ncbi:MAG: BatA and WFA domain-containing protein [Bacteroidia bacterium]|nr:BatA and WFA domain-containing protein [Bacteroidia bacterium]
MQFKQPEILYALILLLIPIIVHLFQLRRFKKVPFTNVEFLKTVTKQTRKSRVLKKWLVLATRLLMLAAIILAFAQPFTSENEEALTESETVIYLDNSFSMQAKGDRGELMRRAVQDLLDSGYDDEVITLFTNDSEFRNVSLKSIQNELVQLDYTGSQLDYEAAVLKGKQMFSSNSERIKNLILISDFQQNREFTPANRDEQFQLKYVQLRPVSSTNISIDSAYIRDNNSNNLELKVKLKSADGSLLNLPVSLFNDDVLTAKTAVDSEENPIASFSLPKNQQINGKLSIEDVQLQFDNMLFFNIDNQEKIKVLSINQADDDFLKRIYTEPEFEYEKVPFEQLNYNRISEQDLIILNELDEIPVALSNALNSFVRDRGYILIIPSNESILNSYNQLLRSVSRIYMTGFIPEEKLITRINYDHPLFEGVFDQEVSNFQYPKVKGLIRTQSQGSPVLQFEDGNPFFIQEDNVFVFTTALNEDHSNVLNSPLIVPTLYNVGLSSLKLPKLYYTIGNDIEFDVNTSIQQDDILKLGLGENQVIPQQRSFPKKVTISIGNNLQEHGIYDILRSNEVLDKVSFNYSRKESDLRYYDLSSQFGIESSDSLKITLDEIKSETEINALWKWFVIFALILLIFEMLILKFVR